MKEKLEVYDLNDKLIGIEDRDKFYKDIEAEFKSTGKITKKVKSIRVLLMNSNGRIYLQKRSKHKEVNPGCYDKTLGGHVPASHSWDLTLIRECAEELGFPATVLSIDEFDKAIKVTDLSVIGIFKKIDYIKDFKSKRKTRNGDYVDQPWMTTIFFGYYDGAIRFVDGESTGIEVFSLSELQEDLKK
ncbi:NUDIX domain-containing protein [Candidatus Woesearchaeota archaeon]|nr:NUDIX domain-containing protein [Candidatus Woesearchaeota archaeon]